MNATAATDSPMHTQPQVGMTDSAARSPAKPQAAEERPLAASRATEALHRADHGVAHLCCRRLATEVGCLHAALGEHLRHRVADRGGALRETEVVEHQRRG